MKNKDVTLDNCIGYITAIDAAIRRDHRNLAPEHRSVCLRMVRTALSSALSTVDEIIHLDAMEQHGPPRGDMS